MAVGEVDLDAVGPFVPRLDIAFGQQQAVEPTKKKEQRKKEDIVITDSQCKP